MGAFFKGFIQGCILFIFVMSAFTFVFSVSGLGLVEDVWDDVQLIRDNVVEQNERLEDIQRSVEELEYQMKVLEAQLEAR